MVETRTVTTAEELLRLPDGGKRHELVRGELREMNPAGARHGRIAMKLGSRLDRHATAENLGSSWRRPGSASPETPTLSVPPTYLSWRERISPGGPPDGYWGLAPDLSVEVVSPNDTAAEVQSKVQMWLEAGTCLVWVVYPSTRSIMIHKSLKNISTLTATDALDGDDVAPGFEIPVAEVFEWLSRGAEPPLEPLDDRPGEHV